MASPTRKVNAVSPMVFVTMKVRQSLPRFAFPTLQADTWGLSPSRSPRSACNLLRVPEPGRPLQLAAQVGQRRSGFFSSRAGALRGSESAIPRCGGGGAELAVRHQIQVCLFREGTKVQHSEGPPAGRFGNDERQLGMKFDVGNERFGVVRQMPRRARTRRFGDQARLILQRTDVFEHGGEERDQIQALPSANGMLRASAYVNRTPG